MARKSDKLNLKIKPCKKCKKKPRLKMGLSFYYECACGQMVSGVYGDGILEVTKKWNNEQA